MKHSPIKSTFLAIVPVIMALAVPNMTPTYGQFDNRAQVLKIPFDGLIDNLECAGELIAVTGDILIVSQVKQNMDGDLHIQGHVIFQGFKGTGVDSGMDYVIFAAGSNIINARFDGGSTTNEVNNFQLNALGPNGGFDAVAHVNIHFTVNANGELTAEVTNIDVQCR